MKLHYLILLSVFILSGCETIVYKDRIVPVKTMVFKDPPKVPKVKEPIYAIMTINENSSDDDVAKAYVITVKQQKDVIERLKLAAEPFQED